MSGAAAVLAPAVKSVVRNVCRTAAIVAFAAASGAAFAAPITPAYDTFGALTGATFGGSGIPNHAVAITGCCGDVTLGLKAHQRFVGPNLANNGAGTFTAFVGNSNTPADPYATWNFGFYIGGSGASDVTFRLLYDFDPGAGTDSSAHGSITTPGIFLPSNPAQNSWNLGMDFLATPATGLVPPAFGPFNPNVPGEYTFALIALDGQSEIARAAIRVNVLREPGAAVPEPGTLALAGLALFGLAARRRKR